MHDIEVVPEAEGAYLYIWLEAFLDHGMDPNVVVWKDSSGQRYLLPRVVAIALNPECVELLLDSGADACLPREEFPEGSPSEWIVRAGPPLWLAAMNPNMDGKTVRMLVDAKADVDQGFRKNLREDGPMSHAWGSVLFESCISSSVSVFETLLELGFDAHNSVVQECRSSSFQVRNASFTTSLSEE